MVITNIIEFLKTHDLFIELRLKVCARAHNVVIYIYAIVTKGPVT